MKKPKTIEELEKLYFIKAKKAGCPYELRKILYDAIYDAYWLGDEDGAREEKRKHKFDQAEITMEE